MRSYGAEVVLHGADFEASKRYCAELEAEEGLRFISSGDEPLLVAWLLDAHAGNSRGAAGCGRDHRADRRGSGGGG